MDRLGFDFDLDPLTGLLLPAREQRQHPSWFNMPHAMFAGGQPMTKVVDMQFDQGNGSLVYLDTGTAGSGWTSGGTGTSVCSTSVVLGGVSSLNIPDYSTYLTTAYTPLNRIPPSGNWVITFKAQASSWLSAGGVGCYILSCQDSGLTAAGTAIAVATDLNQQLTLILSNGASRIQLFTPNYTLPTNTPLTFVVSRVGNNISVKVNGILAGSGTYASNINYPTGGEWRIGKALFGTQTGPLSGFYFDAFTISKYEFSNGSGASSWAWSPTRKGSAIALSNSNFTADGSNGAMGVLGNTPKNSGKWQFEVTVNTGTNCLIGVAHAAMVLANYPGTPLNANAVSYNSVNGNKYGLAANAAYGATYTSGDVIGCVVDFTAQTITFYKNGASQGSTGYWFTEEDLYPAFGAGGSVTTGPRVTVNTTLQYPVSGASQWNNVPDTELTSSCIFLLNGQGLNNSTSFIDSSSYAHVQQSVVAPAVIDTSTFVYGSSSMNFTGGRVYFNYASEMYTNRRSFTMETWAKGNATANASRCILVSQATSSGSNGTFALVKNTANRWYASLVTSTGVGYSATEASTSSIYSNWNHIVGQRWGNSVLLHVNGALVARVEILNALPILNNTVNKFAVGGDGEYNQSSGGYGGTYGDRWPGWLQDFRWISGKAIYLDQAFTPPVAQLTTSY